MEMNPKPYSIPYINQPIKFWEEIKQNFGTRIKAVYFPLESNLVGSGRPPQPANFLSSFLGSRILPANLLINPVVLPHQYHNLQHSLLKEVESYILRHNIQGVTVSNVDFAKDIKKYFPGVELTASTLMEIGTEQQLVMIEGIFDVIVPSTKVIRDIKTLRTLRNAYSGKIKIIVNESCLSSCIYRTQHFYEMSNPSISHPNSLCNTLLEKKPWLRLTGSWILPQHIHLIDGLFDELKLAGRISLSNPKRFNNVLKSYVNRKPLFPNEIGGGPASVYLPMEIKAEFFKTTLECNKNCGLCTICKNYWEENIAHYG